MLADADDWSAATSLIIRKRLPSGEMSYVRPVSCRDKRALACCVCECFGEDLQGDVAIQLCIAGAVHLAHAAGADDGNDLILTEANAGRQAHRADEL